MYLTPIQINSHSNIANFENKSAYKPYFNKFSATQDIFVKSSFGSSSVSFGAASNLVNESAVQI